MPLLPVNNITGNSGYDLDGLNWFGRAQNKERYMTQGASSPPTSTHIQTLTFLIPLTEPISYHNVSAMVNKEATAIGMGVYILATGIWAITLQRGDILKAVS